MKYVGRIVCIGRTHTGKLCAAYRVSSRSFPNRRAVMRDNAISIIPKPGHESDIEKNPYIAYNCARVTCGGKVAVVTNGSQTDPITEKIAAGMPVRDALALSLLALDYEHDQLDTPRICVVADARGDGACWLAIVRKDGLNVRCVPLAPGHFQYVATYEENDLLDAQSGVYEIASAGDACDFLLSGGVFAERANPVTSVAALETDSGFELAAKDAVLPS